MSSGQGDRHGGQGGQGGHHDQHQGDQGGNHHNAWYGAEHGHRHGQQHHQSSSGHGSSHDPYAKDHHSGQPKKVSFSTSGSSALIGFGDACPNNKHHGRGHRDGFPSGAPLGFGDACPNNKHHGHGHRDGFPLGATGAGGHGVGGHGTGTGTGTSLWKNAVEKGKFQWKSYEEQMAKTKGGGNFGKPF